MRDETNRVVRTISELEQVKVQHISSTSGMPPSDPLLDTTDRDAG